MSTGSRFASLAHRVRSAMGTGDVSIIALDAVDGDNQGGGEGGDVEEQGGAPAPPAPPPPAPAPPPPPATSGDEMDEAASETAVAAARAEERQRVTAVFASEASNGKERVAAKLLANAKLSADDIIGMLPDCAASASDGMLKRLADQPNPDLAPGAEAGGDRPKASASILAAQRAMTGKKQPDPK
jgi:hypothetical protein